MVQVPECPICKGKRPYCIHKSYPLPPVKDIQRRVEERLSKDFFGPSYSVFVGRYGYPNVNMGPMTGLESVQDIDNPEKWFGLNYSTIIELRSMLVRSKKPENIFSRSRFVQENQELVIAHKAPDTEITFRKKPHYTFTVSETFQPMGPSASLEKMRITENVRVKPFVERIVDDELKSKDSAYLLFDKGLNVYKISNILSSGILGMEKNKKLVPSRWSVTATDDMLTKEMLRDVREFPQIKDFLVFEAEHLDNHFVIILMPGNWEYENFEAWAPGSNWSKFTSSKIIPEYEPFMGRKGYAESQAGGYYAARLPAVKYLHSIKRQARVLSFREVSEGYTIPLGVWVVREVASNAFKNPPRRFSTFQEARDHANKRLKLDINQYLKLSKLMRQRRLNEF